MTALIAVPSLAVVTLVVVVIYCYRTKRVKKSTSQNQPLTSSHNKHGSSKESFNSHRSYQQCMMHTSFVDGGGGGGGNGTMGGAGAGAGAGAGGGGGGGACGGGGGAGPGGGGGGAAAGGGGGGGGPAASARLPGMEVSLADIDDQQLQIPIPRPPDPNYRTHQKRASYTMMKQNFEDGNNAVIAEI